MIIIHCVELLFFAEVAWIGLIAFILPSDIVKREKVGLLQRLTFVCQGSEIASNTFVLVLLFVLVE